MPLFTSPLGPIKFHLVGLSHSEVVEIEKMVVENGGELTVDRPSSLIKFTKREEFTGNELMFDVQYIPECIRKQKILHLRNFTLGRLRDPVEYCSNSVFLYGNLCQDRDYAHNVHDDFSESQFFPAVTSTQNEIVPNQDRKKLNTSNKSQQTVTNDNEITAKQKMETQKYCDMGIIVGEADEDEQSNSDKSSLLRELIAHAEPQLENNDTSGESNCCSDVSTISDSVGSFDDVAESPPGADKNAESRTEDDCSSARQIVTENSSLIEHNEIEDGLSDFSMASTVTFCCLNIPEENRFCVERDHNSSLSEDCYGAADSTFDTIAKERGEQNVDEESEVSKSDDIFLTTQDYLPLSPSVIAHCQNSSSSENYSSNENKGSKKEDYKKTDKSKSDRIELSTQDFEPMSQLSADKSVGSYSSEDFVSSGLQEMIRNEKEMEPEKDVEKTAEVSKSNDTVLKNQDYATSSQLNADPNRDIDSSEYDVSSRLQESAIHEKQIEQEMDIGEESESNDVVPHTKDNFPLIQLEAVESEDVVCSEDNANSIKNDNLTVPEKHIQEGTEEAESNSIVFDTQDLEPPRQSNADKRDINSSESNVNQEQQNVIMNDEKIEQEKNINEKINKPECHEVVIGTQDFAPLSEPDADERDINSAEKQLNKEEQNNIADEESVEPENNDKPNNPPVIGLCANQSDDVNILGDFENSEQQETIEHEELVGLEENIEASESNNILLNTQDYAPLSQLSTDKDSNTKSSEYQLIGKKQEVVENLEQMEPEKSIQGKADEFESNCTELDTVLDSPSLKHIGANKERDYVTSPRQDMIENHEPIEPEKEIEENAEESDLNITVLDSQYHSTLSHLSEDKDRQPGDSESQVVCTQQELTKNDEEMELEKGIDENADKSDSRDTMSHTQYYSPVSILDADKDKDFDRSEYNVISSQQEIIEHDKSIEPEKDNEGNANDSYSTIPDSQYYTPPSQLRSDKDIDCSENQELNKNDKSTEPEEDLEGNAEQSESNVTVLDTQNHPKPSLLGSEENGDTDCSDNHVFSTEQNIVENEEQMNPEKDIEENVDKLKSIDIGHGTHDYTSLSHMDANKDNEYQLIITQQNVVENFEEIEPAMDTEGNDESTSINIVLDTQDFDPLSQVDTDTYKDSDSDLSEHQLISTQQEIIENVEPKESEKYIERHDDESESFELLLDTEDFAPLSQLATDQDRDIDSFKDRLISNQSETLENDHPIEEGKVIEGNVIESESNDIIHGTDDYSLLEANKDINIDCSENHAISLKEGMIDKDQPELNKSIDGSTDEFESNGILLDTQDFSPLSQLRASIDTDSDSSENHLNSEHLKTLLNYEEMETGKDLDQSEPIATILDIQNDVPPDKTDSNNVDVFNQDYIPLVTLQKDESSTQLSKDAIALKTHELVDIGEESEEENAREESVKSANDTVIGFPISGDHAPQTTQKKIGSVDINFTGGSEDSQNRDCISNENKNGHEENKRKTLNESSKNVIVPTNQDYIPLEVLESVENRHFSKGDTKYTHQECDEEVKEKDQGNDSDESINFESNDIFLNTQDYISLSSSDNDIDAVYSHLRTDADDVFLEITYEEIELDENKSDDAGSHLINIDDRLSTPEEVLDRKNNYSNNGASVGSTGTIGSGKGMEKKSKNSELGLIDLTNDSDSTSCSFGSNENQEHTTNTTNCVRYKKKEQYKGTVKSDTNSNYSAVENNLPMSEEEDKDVWIDVRPLNKRLCTNLALSHHENHEDSNSCDSLLNVGDSDTNSTNSNTNVRSAKNLHKKSSEHSERKRNQRRESDHSQNIPQTADRLQTDSENDTVSEIEDRSTRVSSAKIVREDSCGYKQTEQRRNDKREKIHYRNIPKSDYRVHTIIEDESVPETGNKSTRVSSAKSRCEEPSGSKRSGRRRFEKRLQTDSDESDSITDDSFTQDNFEQPKRRKTEMRRDTCHPNFYRPAARKFENWERRKMINYLIENNAINSSRGMSIWQQMSDEKVLDRTPFSLNNHFRKSILPNIRNYNLDQDTLHQFLRLSKNIND